MQKNVNMNKTLNKIGVRKRASKWEKFSTQKEFLENLRQKLNFEVEDFEQMTLTKFRLHGGTNLLNLYHQNIYEIFQTHYPTHQWDKYKHFKANYGYWETRSNLKNFFDNLYNKLNFKTWKDWYKLKNKTIIENGGNSILQKNSGSLFFLLKRLYPQHDWNILENIRFPNGFWHSIENQRLFLTDFAKKFNIENYEQWYEITNQKIIKNRGGGLLNMYNGSLFDALKSIFPDENWNLMKSSKRNRIQNKKEFSIHLIKEFSIEKKEDWYRISNKQIKNSNCACLIHSNSSLFRFLSNFYDDQQWNQSYFLQSIKRSAQRALFINIKRLIDKQIVMEEYYHPLLKFKSGSFVQFDVFVPSIEIAFEYQGEQHFDDIPSNFASIEACLFRDSEKKSLCDLFGIRLITVPYWWNSRDFLSLHSLFHSNLSFQPCLNSSLK